MDPSIGRFRNLIQTAVIPNKKQKLAASSALAPAMATAEGKMRRRISGDSNLYDDLPEAQAAPQLPGLSFTTMSKLGLSVPNPAPEVDIDENPFVAPQPPHGRLTALGFWGFFDAFQLFLALSLGS